MNEALATLDFGHRERLVRVNAIGTPEFRDDMAALATMQLQPVARRRRVRSSFPVQRHAPAVLIAHAVRRRNAIWSASHARPLLD